MSAPSARADALAALAALQAPAARSVEALAEFAGERARLLAAVVADPRPYTAAERAWADAAAATGELALGGAQQLAAETLAQLAEVQQSPHAATGRSGPSTLHRFG